MSCIVIRDLERNTVLDGAAMHSIVGGALFFNLYDVYNHPWNYDDGIVKIANDHFNGD